jgi:ribose transport system permease protein
LIEGSDRPRTDGEGALTAPFDAPPQFDAQPPPEELPSVYRRLALNPKLRGVVSRYAVVLAFGVLVVIFSILEPSTFPTIGTVRVVVNSQAMLLMLALGLTLPLVTGDFDLSIGATMGLAGSLVGSIHGGWHLSDAPSIGLALAACAAVGLGNAFIIVKLGINAFIATLATSTIVAGLTLYVSHGGIITTIPNSLTYFGQTRIPGINIVPPAMVGFGLTILLWYIYEHTPVGRRLYFVGEGREAARLTGLPVARLRGAAFVGASVIAGGAGVLLAGELGGMDPTIGPTYLLPAYAAAFLGATTIRPGRFNALGTLVGLYALVVGVTGLELLGVQSWVEQIFDGCVLAAAVAFARAVSTDSV